MKNFKKAVEEIYLELNKLILFDDIVTSFLIFLGIFAFLIITNISPILALIPAAAYLAIRTSADIKKKRNKVLLIEKNYPELDEKLRTAVDNIQQDNPVVDELKEEVYDGLKKVQTASFISIKKTSYKLGGVVLLCFLILFLAVSNMELIDFDKLLIPIREGYAIGEDSGNATTSPFSSGRGDPDDIFGEESIAELGDDMLNIEITLGGVEPTFIRSEEEIPDEDFEETFVGEVDLVAACREPPCVFENDIPVDEQELVKNYFIELSK